MCRFLVPTAAINPVVLRVEWWFDGKHFFIHKPYEVDCRITVPLQQLLAAGQTGDVIGFKWLLRTTSFDTLELEIATNYSVGYTSIGECQFHVRSHESIGAFWIIFLTEDKVFDILNILVDTHRTRSAMPSWLLINRTHLS